MTKPEDVSRNVGQEDAVSEKVMRSEFLGKVSEIPGVNVAKAYSSAAYDKVKQINRFTAVALSIAETTALYFAVAAKPFLEKVQPQAQLVDHLACCGLEAVKELVEMVCLKVDEIKSLASLNDVKNYGLQKANEALTLTEELVDKCLPLAYCESSLEAAAIEDGKSVPERASQLTSKVGLRVFGHAVKPLWTVHRMSQACVSLLSFTMDLEPLRSSGSDLLDSGLAFRLQSKASQEEPCRKQMAAHRTLLWADLEIRPPPGRATGAPDVDALARDRAEAEEHPEGWGALHLAVKEGDVQTVRQLLTRGFDPRVRDRRGQTPFHCALDWGQKRAAEVLVEADSGNDIPDEEGWTPLHFAARMGWVEIVRKLVAAGARLRHQNKYGETAFYHALVWKREDIAQLLVDLDGENNILTLYGNTPLHLAAEKGYAVIVKKLLWSGICPHIRNYWGEYPLFCAALMGHDDTVKIILAVYAWRSIGMDDTGLFRSCALYLQPLPSHRIDYCMRVHSECKAEIQRMKETRIGKSTVTFYDIAARHANKVARYLRNEDVWNELHGDFVVLGFPNYAELITLKVRRAEERGALFDEFMECFCILSRKLLPLPLSCVESILLYLTERDMENVIKAIKFSS